MHLGSRAGVHEAGDKHSISSGRDQAPGQAVMGLGQSAGEGSQQASRACDCPRGFQSLVFDSAHQKGLLFPMTEKRLEGIFFLCRYWSLSGRNTFGCLIRIFTSEKIIPGVEISLPWNLLQGLSCIYTVPTGILISRLPQELHGTVNTLLLCAMCTKSGINSSLISINTINSLFGFSLHSITEFPLLLFPYPGWMPCQQHECIRNDKVIDCIWQADGRLQGST